MVQRSTPPVAIISCAVVAMPAGSAPLLSAIYWLIALRIALTSEALFVSFAWANCRAGLIAIRVMARRIARIPMTTRSSIRVNPFWSLWAVVFMSTQLLSYARAVVKREKWTFSKTVL